MIVIADSGSTKTAWKVLGSAINEDIFGEGINPFQESPDHIKNKISFLFKGNDHIAGVQKVFYYGAGTGNDTNKSILREALFATFPSADIEVNTDLVAAARATCGRGQGMVAILGTGSNLCFYDGTLIHQNSRSLGFILGDEGSGAFLGKSLIQGILNEEASREIIEKFIARYSVGIEEILNNVYKKPYPNRYLAGFTPFLLENIHDPYIFEIVESAFRLFFKYHISRYDQYKNFPLNLVGSIAVHFESVLTKTLKDLNVNIGRIMAQPMEGLVQFHQSY